MAEQVFATEWLLAGLRCQQRTDGGVEVDLVWRMKGATQTVLPLESTRHSFTCLTEAQFDRIIKQVARAATQVLIDFDLVPEGGYQLAEL
jgi:hypothetical protein